MDGSQASHPVRRAVDYTAVLVRQAASDASVDLVSVLRCVDRFQVSFQGLGLDFLSAKA